jgi:hypothetical protein
MSLSFNPDETGNTDTDIEKKKELIFVVFETLVEQFSNDWNITAECLKMCREIKETWIEDVINNILRLARDRYNDQPLAVVKMLEEYYTISVAGLRSGNEDDLVQNFENLVADLNEYAESKIENGKNLKTKLFLDLIQRIIECHSYL